MNRLTLTLALCVVCVFGGITANAAPVDEVLEWAPKPTNAVIAIDVASLMQTPLAAKEDWKSRQESNYLAGVSSLPPNTNFMLKTLHLDHNRLTADWSLQLNQTSQRLDLLKVAKSNNTLANVIAGCSYVDLPRGSLVELTKSVVGMGQIRNRQEFAKKLKAAKENRSVKLEKYLEQAVRSAGPRAQIVMALDLEDVLGEKELRQGLTNLSAMKGKQDQIDSMVQSLGKVIGIQFSLNVTDKFNGELRVDFEQLSGTDHDLLKSVLFEVLDETGLLFPEIKEWKSERARNALVLSGVLDDRSMMRLVALVDPQSGAVEAEALGDSEEAKAAFASRNYFRATQAMIADLSRDLAKPLTYNAQASWYDWYANKIDHLSLRHVDPDMQKYGQDVSGKLRLIGLNTRGVATSQNLAESQRQQQGAAWGPSWSGGGSYGWGYGGGYNYNYNPGGMWYSNNYQEVKTAQTAASAKGQKERNEIWNQLNENSNIIRQRMSSKYKIGF